MEMIKNALTASFARGALWVLATIAAKAGIDSANNEAMAASIGQFAASALIALVSLWWSKKSATTLLNTAPPDPTKALKPKPARKHIAAPLIFLAAMVMVGCTSPAAEPKAVATSETRNRALLVGINEYPGAPLEGCVNDIDDDAAYLIKCQGFHPWEIMVLTDRDATTANIKAGMKWVAADYRPGDRRFFAYSGHGAQMPGSKEGDHKYEVICPVDFDWSEEHVIRDVDFMGAFEGLPKGAIFDWISDSCHAGGLADDKRFVPGFRSRAYPVPAAIAARLAADPVEARSIKHSRLNVGYMAGCRSNQTSADASFKGRPNGAFTYFWLKRLQSDPGLSQDKLAAALRADLKAAGFSQLPQADGQRTGRAFLK